ncbi:MAG TPA: hypothetical protein VLJ38_09785 [Polyangiaceae bacterium]|nr:hypothetical protein [Polyangiaceae bacterium]
MSVSRAPVSSFCAPARGLGIAAFGLLLALAVMSCGGSSSETPPPLEPTPSNVRYDRSATTTLPGEIATPTHAAPPPSATAAAPAPKRLRPPSSSQY